MKRIFHLGESIERRMDFNSMRFHSREIRMIEDQYGNNEGYFFRNLVEREFPTRKGNPERNPVDPVWTFWQLFMGSFLLGEKDKESLGLFVMNCFEKLNGERQ